jgi:hypothetical protein
MKTNGIYDSCLCHGTCASRNVWWKKLEVKLIWGFVSPCADIISFRMKFETRFEVKFHYEIMPFPSPAFFPFKLSQSPVSLKKILHLLLGYMEIACLALK